MFAWTRIFVPAALAVGIVAAATPASAGVGDLLVAPTRIILDGRRGTEIVLNNVGDQPATRGERPVSRVPRMSMTAATAIMRAAVADPTPREKAAADMIIYAPHRVTLAPHQPQSIRIAARPPAGLPDGEYRVHMLFRAIPPATPAILSRRSPRVASVAGQSADE